MKKYKLRFLSTIIVASLSFGTLFCVPDNITLPVAPSTNMKLEIAKDVTLGFLLGATCLAIYMVVRGLMNPVVTQMPEDEEDPLQEVTNTNIPVAPPIDNNWQNFRKEKKAEARKKRALEMLELQTETKKRKEDEQQFRQMGIEEYLIPFVKYARQDGNKLYIQLKTVNQTSNDVNGPVKTFHASLFNALQRGEDGKKRTLEQRDWDWLRGFNPCATCYALSVRSAELLNRFLSRVDEQDMSALGQLQNNQDARIYLENRLNHKDENDDPDPQATSWGETHQLNAIIRANNLDHAISTVSSVLLNEDDAVVKGKNPEAFADEKQKIRTGALNPYHVFIIETGDAYPFLIPAIQRLQVEENIELERIDIAQIDGKERGKTHFYVAAAQRIGEGDQAQFRYYIADTIPYNNHIEWQVFLNRDQYLCEHLVDGHTVVDYKTFLQQTAENTIKVHLQTKKMIEKEKKKLEARKKILEEKLKKKKEEEEKKKREFDEMIEKKDKEQKKKDIIEKKKK